MTKEMYDTLKVTDLRGIAKQRGMTVPARVKKEELIRMMIELDEQEARKKEASPAPAADQSKQPRAQKQEVSGTEESVSRGSKQENSGADGSRKKKTIVKRAQENVPAKEAGAENQENRGRAASPAPMAIVPPAFPPKTSPAQAGSRENAAQPAPAARENTPSVQPQAGAPGSAPNNTDMRYQRRGLTRPDTPVAHKNELNRELDSGEIAHGILEVMPDGFGFIRSANYMPGDEDVYVAPSQIRRFNLKTGDIIEGNIRIRTQSEKFSALLFVTSVNGLDPEVAKRRFNFEDMTPIFPDERIRLEKAGASVAMRVMDLMCPVGKGQRGMIVSPPKAGKTTLLKEVARSVKMNNPEIHMIILLIDERPEEVTDIREAIEGPNVEVIYSTFDELPEHHKRVSEMTIERAKRLVEQRQDVMILLDSITRLTRAYNLTEPSSGRTLSGGLDPAALHMPKRFFGAARNMREGGSLTILATALIETGSKMDDVVYEEFKGTGNMEMVLNRKLSERRIFPAIDLAKSGTRRDDLLLTPDELESIGILRRAFVGSKGEEATDDVLNLFSKTRTNGEFVNMVRKLKWTF